MKIDKYSAILGNTVGFHDMSSLTDHRPIAGSTSRFLASLMQESVVYLVSSSKKTSVLSLTIFALVVSGACQLF